MIKSIAFGIAMASAIWCTFRALDTWFPATVRHTICVEFESGRMICRDVKGIRAEKPAAAPVEKGGPV